MRASAIVIGGGIAGLAAARALLAAGLEVQVHERAGTLPTSGTALGMWPEAMRALDRLGVGERARAASVPAAGASILRPDGSTVTRIGERRSARLIARTELLAALYDGLPDDVVVWHSSLDSRSTVPVADVVVAADGINSGTRTTLLGVRPRPLGTVAFRGVVPGAAGGVSETWGAGRLFGITSSSPVTTNWFASVRAERLSTVLGRAPVASVAGSPWSPAAGGGGPPAGPSPTDVDVLRELYRGWHPAVARVLDELDATGVDRRTLADVPPLQSYVVGRTVLVGDAAHAMAPNLGRGACESLIDAVSLGDALESGRDVDTALRRYDAVRRPATTRVVRAARAMNRVATAERLLAARDVAARLAGALEPRP